MSERPASGASVRLHVTGLSVRHSYSKGGLVSGRPVPAACLRPLAIGLKDMGPGCRPAGRLLSLLVSPANGVSSMAMVALVSICLKVPWSRLVCLRL